MLGRALGRPLNASLSLWYQQVWKQQGQVCVQKIMGRAGKNRLGYPQELWLLTPGSEKEVQALELALAGVAPWIECWPVNQKVNSLSPSQGTCLGCGPGSWMGACERQHLSYIDASLPLFLPPFPSF